MTIKNINHYIDVSFLKRGGHSYILKAKNSYSQKYCIIKISIDKNKESHLYNESKILSKINHNNIIKLLDVNKVENRLFLVLELLDGLTLQEYININGPQSYNKTLDILEQICIGVKYLHSINIVHKDLKPQNIFMCNNGDIKILDFGLSCDMKDINELNFSKKSIVGTIDYISPAQILNSNNTEKRYDIYSIAIILYFIVTGNKIYNSIDINKKIRNKFYGYCNIKDIVDTDILQIFNKIMQNYEHKIDNIDNILNLLQAKKIINGWNLC